MKDGIPLSCGQRYRPMERLGPHKMTRQEQNKGNERQNETECIKERDTVSAKREKDGLKKWFRQVDKKMKE